MHIMTLVGYLPFFTNPQPKAEDQKPVKEAKKETQESKQLDNRLIIELIGAKFLRIS